MSAWSNFNVNILITAKSQCKPWEILEISNTRDLAFELFLNRCCSCSFCRFVVFMMPLVTVRWAGQEFRVVQGCDCLLQSVKEAFTWAFPALDRRVARLAAVLHWLTQRRCKRACLRQVLTELKCKSAVAWCRSYWTTQMIPSDAKSTQNLFVSDLLLNYKWNVLVLKWYLSKSCCSEYWLLFYARWNIISKYSFRRVSVRQVFSLNYSQLNYSILSRCY